MMVLVARLRLASGLVRTAIDGTEFARSLLDGAFPTATVAPAHDG
jgi:hypothetical protein